MAFDIVQMVLVVSKILSFLYTSLSDYFYLWTTVEVKLLANWYLKCDNLFMIMASQAHLSDNRDICVYQELQ